MKSHVTRVLVEGTLRYPTQIGISWSFESCRTVRVFVLDWWEGGSWSGPDGYGRISKATVVFRETAHHYPGERLPIPVGAIREVEASGHDGDVLVVDVT